MRKTTPSTLNEEINRMKKLMNFVISENSHDVLSEQSIEQKVEQTNTEEYSPVTILPKDKVPGRILNIKKTDEGLEKSEKIEGELKGVTGYEELITHLVNYNDQSYPLWFLKFNQETRKNMIELFNSKLIELKEEQRKIDNYKVIIRKEGKDRIEVIPAEELPDAPPIELDFGMVGNDVFVDNKSDVTPTIQSKIDELINKINTNLTEINVDPSQKITLKVKDFMIGASASRFRNTEEAADLTWADLSSERAKNVKEDLYRKLESLGVITSEGTIEFKGGWNGDGTSGPNPGLDPKGKPYTISKDGTYDNYYTTVTKEIRNQYGKPHNTKEEYDKYKWLLVSITLVAVIDTVEPVRPTDITYRGYTLEIIPFKTPGTYKFPLRSKLKIDLFKKREKKKKSKDDLTRCPKFRGKVKDPWWLRLPAGGGA